MSHISASGLKLKGCWTEYIVMIPLVHPYRKFFQYSSVLTHLKADLPLRQDRCRNLE